MDVYSPSGLAAALVVLTPTHRSLMGIQITCLRPSETSAVDWVLEFKLLSQKWCSRDACTMKASRKSTV